MGKNKKRKQQVASQGQGPKNAAVTKPTAKNSNEDKGAKPHGRVQQQFPLPFPEDLSLPKTGFLRNDDDTYQASYSAALDTAYEGFVVDPSTLEETERDSELFPHLKIRNALTKMVDAGFFRTDITQPFGPGSKCAKTYVTRCLLGEPGTTYKYLGLRMFAHPWDGSDCNDSGVRQAQQCMRNLNERLTNRTTHHLEKLHQKRKKRGASVCGSSREAKYDVTLINRMEYSKDLKKEPTTGQGRCSVSWHADSCLEHYSNIAVYHTIMSDEESGHGSHGSHSREGKWSVALRVAHNSEGPEASRRGTDIESSIVREAPAIAACLPSGSAYYLLDDFNHHHQHAVLAQGESNAGVRFSSTHRLLREGHNVNFVIDRCRTVCSHFHKKGMKVWKAEQMILTEVESEWLRQFYIQGEGHRQVLWKAWKDPLTILWNYWSKLENRTKQTIDLLYAAAEGKCIEGSSQPQSSSQTRAERKAREKQHKAVAALDELIARIGTPASGNMADDMIYGAFASLLDERASMRERWIKRERDPVFCQIGNEYAPIPLPAQFNVTQSDQSNRNDWADTGPTGVSPLKGGVDELRSIAECIRVSGRAFLSRDRIDLPSCLNKTVGDAKSSKGLALDDRNAKAKIVPQEGDDHAKSMTWAGWANHSFCLEMQEPWAEFLLQGKKTIETRAYDIPPSLLGKKLYILQSQKGKEGRSSLGNIIGGNNIGPDKIVNPIGWCIINHVIKYTTKAMFDADRDKHLVDPNSGYGWKENKTNAIFGWVVATVQHMGTNEEPEWASISKKRLVRRYRSLFEIEGIPPFSSKDVKEESPELMSPLQVGNARKKKKRQKKAKSVDKTGKKRRF